MNLKLIIRILGFLIFGEGIALLISLLVSLFYGGPDLPAFIITSVITLTTGGLLLVLTRNAVKDIGKREGFCIVAFSWVTFSFFGSLPYIISGSIPNFTNAFFETISGFTTTGSSILTNIEALPHGILFWRSFTQWLGGMGIIVLSLAILPVFGIGGIQLFTAEYPSPTLDKISPKIRQTAKTLWIIYTILTLIETILLRIGGMTLFDAINHSLTTMATGGFSTKQVGITYWDSYFIQYVVIIFMFLGGTNFTLFYIIFKSKFRTIFKDEEFKYYSFFVLGFTLFIFTGLLITTSLDIEKAFRDSLFQVVSIITTTGFITANYLSWTPVLIILIFALFFFGGCAGSTSGGIKIMRIVLLIKNSYYELRRIIHPNAI
ncbi:MAG: TrkH family potassium uptake protein, partial [Bacteroidales bacterium]|nr:TrkH family potassium uptake protein [Bacteroidales bacterium]